MPFSAGEFLGAILKHSPPISRLLKRGGRLSALSGILMLNLVTCLIFISFSSTFSFPPAPVFSFFPFPEKMASTLFSIPYNEYFVIMVLKEN